MNKRIFGLASVALLGCRAVLGIEELELAGNDAGSDAGADVSTDARAEASSDAGGGAKTDVAACSAKPDLRDCSMCCRETFGPAVGELEKVFEACVCAASCAGTTGCNTTLCTGGSVSGTECPKCIDEVVRGGSCKKENDACDRSPTCEPALTCIRACSN